MGRLTGGVPIGLRSISRLELNYKTVYSAIYAGERVGYSSDVVIPFMHLPNLMTLSVGGFGGNVGDWSTGVQPPGFHSALPSDAGLIQPGCSSITDLHFTESFAGSRLVNSILKLPRALEKFEYELSQSDDPAPPFMTRDLIPGLHLHKDTLTHLTLSDTRAYGKSFATEGILIGSLSEFTALTHLRLPLMLLIGRPPETTEHQVVSKDPIEPLLPSSLVSFKLDLLEHFQLDLFVKTTGFPDTWLKSKQRLRKLKKFAVYRSSTVGVDDHKVFSSPAFSNLIERFQAAGIKIQPPLM
jgi:hypothetical protein